MCFEHSKDQMKKLRAGVKKKRAPPKLSGHFYKTNATLKQFVQNSRNETHADRTDSSAQQNPK